MSYYKLKDFIVDRMKMSHIYQPVFIKELIKGKGSASLQDIAKAFVNYDKSQQDYYEYITKVMPSRVLKAHGLINKDKDKYFLTEEYKYLTEDEAKKLIELCDNKIDAYLEKRTNLYDHRKRNVDMVPGSLRYKIIKRAGSRCEACGISSEDRAIDVDHIIPKNRGGNNDESNLQALCYKCNRQKRDTDDTDFHKIKESYKERDIKCVFCNPKDNGIKVIDENELALVFRDGYPVTEGHTLIIPKRHVSDYFELHQPELNAINELLYKHKEKLQKEDKSITAFNVGVNCGEDAGQSIFHVHVHLIPRRKGDMEEPKGGVRGVIPGKQKY